MKIGRLLLRLTVGGFFFGHGTQKLFGWFGGHGLDATSQMFDGLGMRPGRRNAVAAGVAEAGGGAALALGLATPLAAGTLTSVMLTAIHRVHLKNGPWATNGGYEYNAVLIAAVLALAEVGPGEVSLDHAARDGAERSRLGAARRRDGRRRRGRGAPGRRGLSRAACPACPDCRSADDAGPAAPAEPAGESTTAPSQ